MGKLGLTAFVLALMSCNANLKVITSSGDFSPEEELNIPPAEGEVPSSDQPAGTKPPVFQGEFDFTRTHIQTRTLTSLRLHGDIVQSGERFSLWNETTKVEILDESRLSFALDSGDGWDFEQGYALYQLAPPSHSTAFHYGVNKIRLDVYDDIAPRYALSTITLRDFTMFELGLTSFDENVQTKGNFQGWVNSVAQPSVSAQGTTLTVGMPNIINR